MADGEKRIMKTIEEVVRGELALFAIMFTFESMAMKDLSDEAKDAKVKEIFDKYVQQFLKGVEKNQFVIVPKEPALDIYRV
jgi:hypothetical protein